jgi:hypothetical protein
MRLNPDGLPILIIAVGCILFWVVVGETLYGLTHRSTPHNVAK